MHVPFLDLKAQYKSIQPEMDAAIAKVLSETAFIAGKYAEAFEKNFAKWVGTKHCIGVANGTDAIEMALKAMGVGAGDEVIVPAHTWISTAEAVTAIGGRVVFVDTDPRYYTMDPAKIEARITKRTKVIVPVHLYGMPVDMDGVMAVAKKHGLKVLEDCAQSHGATFKGKKTGTFGDAATFSFYPGKNLGAYGDAGGIVTNDDTIADTCRMIGNHGQVAKHAHKVEGRNSRLDGIQGAVLDVKLKHLDGWNQQRRANAEIYGRYLKVAGIPAPAVPDYAQHVYHLYVIQVADRDGLMKKLHEAGIDSAVHYPSALHLLEAYKYLGHKETDFPVAAAACKRIISLPMYSELTEEMIKYTVENVARSV
ncbi:MAG: DegT/DnrJ/EryC1/StrS family aminotransferase [Bacteroidota bacterium]